MMKQQKNAIRLPMAVNEMVSQPRGFNLLALPIIGPFFRWKYARFVLQLPLLILVALMLIDGFTGRQIAARNVATTAAWVHYRGLLVIALAIIGNLFCAACPLMFTRGLTRFVEKFLPRKLEWPRFLRNKWLVLIVLLAFFVSYEVFNLWASPYITAWIALGYFGAVFLIDTLFPAGTFCKYVCPLGNFNFSLSSVSPTQIVAVDPDVCRTCVHKPCLYGRETAVDASAAGDRAAFIPLAEIINQNGSGFFPGCETGLYVPTMTGNTDCTLCMNCVRACPYDNVALTTRAPWRELTQRVWDKTRHSMLWLGMLVAVWGVMNAFAMIPQFFDLADQIALTFNTTNEAFIITSLFAVVTVLGMSAFALFAVLSERIGTGKWQLRAAIRRWGYVVVALGFGFWTAHYLFHFLTGATAAVPVLEHFFSYRGANLTPNWRLAQLVPSQLLFPLQAIITALYAMVSMIITGRIGMRDFGRNGVLAMWPMLVFILLFTLLQLLILGQPMEMRGSILGPNLLQP